MAKEGGSIRLGSSSNGSPEHHANEPLTPEGRFKRLLVWSIIWPILLVATYCVAIFIQLLHNQEVRFSQIQFERRVSEARNLRTMLLDMETGIRGFLLTHQASYLQPYTQASMELPNELDKFIDASQGDPDSVRFAAEVEQDVKSWTALASVMVAQSPSNGVDIQLFEKSKHDFDELRETFQRYIDRSNNEDKRLDVQIVQNRDRFKLLAGFGAAALAAGLILGVLLISRRLGGIYHRTTMAYEGQSQRATEASNLYRLITEHSGDLISIVDSQGCYSYVSPSFERVLGLRRDELVGHPVFDFLESDESDSANHWRKLFAAGTGQELIRHRMASGGWAWIEVNARKIDDKLIAVGRDVSDRVQINEELRKLNTELETRVEERTEELSIANKELEAFSYSVSHDLRAPLRSIASFSLILQQDAGPQLDEESQDNLNRIRAASAKMTELIDALLTFSRIVRAELTRSEVDITHIAESILAELGRGSQREIQTTVAPGMTDQADPHLLRIVLENLIENAWKFSSKVDSPKIEIGRENGAYFIRDNGVGFEEQFANKLFQPFERLHTDREFPGTGIGLATSKRIIDRHGGKIWAESTPSVQTTFHFTLRGEVGNSETHEEVSNR